MSPMCRLYQQVLRGFQLPSDTHPGARLQPGPWMVRMSRAKIYVWLRFCVWGCLAFGFGLGASVLGFKWRIWIWDLGSQLFLKRTEGCRKFPDKPNPKPSTTAQPKPHCQYGLRDDGAWSLASGCLKYPKLQTLSCKP